MRGGVLMENRLRLCNNVKIELSYSNNAFRLYISVIDYKHGEFPDWNLIRECARVLDRYTLPSDDFSTATLTYNGIYAGMVVNRSNRTKTVLWYGKNTSKGKEIWNV